MENQYLSVCVIRIRTDITELCAFDKRQYLVKNKQCSDDRLMGKDQLYAQRAE